MIVPPTGVRVLVSTRPVDFRKGMDGLAAYIQEALKTDPFSRVICVFRAKRADRIARSRWDSSGPSNDLAGFTVRLNVALIERRQGPHPAHTWPHSSIIR